MAATTAIAPAAESSVYPATSTQGMREPCMQANVPQTA
jgi:hypothetical protein